MSKEKIDSITTTYLRDLQNSFDDEVIKKIYKLANSLMQCWKENRNVFICGNGGSGANAIHIANDFLYGIGATNAKTIMNGLSIESLVSNQAVMTCLANDIGYENIFSFQLDVKASPNDLLIVLSGSGNSQNIINVLETASRKKIKTFAIVAFEGGRCKDIADEFIHIKENNMELAEDTQMIIFNICKKYLSGYKEEILFKN